MAKRLLWWLAATLVGVVFLAGCGQRNAALDNYDADIASAALDPADNEPAAASAATSDDRIETSAPAPAETVVAEPSPEPPPTPSPVPPASSTETPVDSGTDSTTDTVEADVNPTELEGLGAELGCKDSTQLRLRFSNSPVRDEARQMPRSLWLCASSASVLERLECYPEETKVLIAAIEDRMGEQGPAAAESLRADNSVWCADPTVLRLGLDP